MRRDDFEGILRSLLARQGARAVALICDRDVRSDRMNARLNAAGFADIIDVPGGRIGSGAGPGWIAGNLPLRVPAPAELDG